LSKNGQKVVKKLSKSCQKVVKKLSKSCKKMSKNGQKSCQKVAKSCQKVDKKLSKSSKFKIQQRWWGVGGVWVGGEIVVPRPSASALLTGRRQK
jgi:hypothetical protein